MTHVTCKLTAKNRDQFRNPTLGNRGATFYLTYNIHSKFTMQQAGQTGGYAAALMTLRTPQGAVPEKGMKWMHPPPALQQFLPVKNTAGHYKLPQRYLLANCY